MTNLPFLLIPLFCCYSSFFVANERCIIFEQQKHSSQSASQPTQHLHRIDKLPFSYCIKLHWINLYSFSSYVSGSNMHRFFISSIILWTHFALQFILSFANYFLLLHETFYYHNFNACVIKIMVDYLPSRKCKMSSQISSFVKKKDIPSS